MLLLNPGPVTLSERVRRSLLKPDLCHREPEFFDLQDEARARLLALYDLPPASWQAVLLSGSGTAAVESMITGLVPESGHLLVVANGVYGERIAEMARRHRIAHQLCQHDWLAGADLDAITARIKAARASGHAFTHLAVVHHETTSGRLNDLTTLDALCGAHGLRLLVDGVSSFGAEAIPFEASSLDAVAATANKCLHGVPGVAFVVTRRSALARGAQRGYYLDLGRLAALQDARNTPFTPAVHAFYALVEALRELAEAGGRTARHAAYARLARQVETGLAAHGVTAVLPRQQSSVVLRAYRLPAGADYATLHDALKAHGFVIYAGQGGLSAELFRISTMGAVSEADMTRLIEAFAPFAS